ncbi:Syntaxin-8 [Lamellibrachia satsuma]|nr:Syntaxin-8 [Lamellibrachia satsuma]
MSGDSWSIKYDACAQLGQSIMERLNERNQETRGSTAYTKLSAIIRTSTQKFSVEVNKLREDLIATTVQHRLLPRESERRQAMLDQLITKEKQINQAFRNERPTDFEQRSALIGGTTGFGDDPWSSEPAEGASGYSVDDIRQQQRQVIQEQDTGLEALSSVIGRQKQMALDLGNEVDNQNELIDDIMDHTDRTDQRLIKETRHINIVDRKSNTCCMWVTIVLLFLAIVIIAVVPFNGKP